MGIVTLEDVRDQGLSEADADDPTVEAAIERAQVDIELWTGRWFEPVAFTDEAPLRLDGSGMRILELPVPVIGSTLTRALEDDEELELADLVVYSRVRPDDRFYPRIEKKSTTSRAVLFDSDSEPSWRQGELNIALTGTFGFCEADGTSPPPAIKRVALRLVIQHGYYRLLTDAEEAGEALGQASQLRREVTDGHEYELQAGAGRSSVWPTGDPLVDEVIRRYRPVFIGSTRGRP